MISSTQPVIAARISRERKAAFAALATSRGLTESSLLMLLVDSVLERNGFESAAPREGERASDRITLRLRPGDRALLARRARARGTKPSTYLVALLRAHVRRNAPLPSSELNRLKAIALELSSLRRSLENLSHLDKSLDQEGSDQPLLRQTVSLVSDVRAVVRELVKTNLMSWETDDA